MQSLTRVAIVLHISGYEVPGQGEQQAPDVLIGCRGVHVDKGTPGSVVRGIGHGKMVGALDQGQCAVRAVVRHGLVEGALHGAGGISLLASVARGATRDTAVPGAPHHQCGHLGGGIKKTVGGVETRAGQGTPGHAERHGHSGVPPRRSGPPRRGRATHAPDHGDHEARAGQGTPGHAGRHGQPGALLPQKGPLRGGRAALPPDPGDQEAHAPQGAPRDVDGDVQPGEPLRCTTPLHQGRAAPDSDPGDSRSGCWAKSTHPHSRACSPC